MAKRRKTIYAGDMVYDVAYTIPTPRIGKTERRAIRQISDEAMAKWNCTTATRKLEMRMAAGFRLNDLVVTLTYREKDYPESYAAAQRRLQWLLRHLRDHRRARGQELIYIYVSEGKHGDHRLHHHVILNAVGDDLEIIRSLWKWGDQIDLSRVDEKGYEGWAVYLSKERREASLNGKKMFVASIIRSLWKWGDQIDLSRVDEKGYEGWAVYLSKERREASLNGKKMFVASKNCPKPEIEYAYLDDGATIEPPPGAVDITDSADRNAYASYRYLKYRLPGKVHKAVSFSGSKLSLTSRRACRKPRAGLPVKGKPAASYRYLKYRLPGKVHKAVSFSGSKLSLTSRRACRKPRAGLPVKGKPAIMENIGRIT